MHFYTLRIFHTPNFPYSSFSTLRTFHTPHFPYSALSILLIFHTPHFPYSAFSTLRTPRFPSNPKKQQYRLQGFDSQKHGADLAQSKSCMLHVKKNDKLSSKENKFQINLW